MLDAARPAAAGQIRQMSKWAEWYRGSANARMKHRDNCDRWIAKNRARYRLYVQNRWRRIRECRHPDCDDAAVKRIYCRAQTLTLLHPHLRRFEVDHIIPIARGGWHHQLNLCVRPMPENRSKKHDPFWESPRSADWRDVPEFLWPPGLASEYLTRRERNGAPNRLGIQCPPMPMVPATYPSPR